MKKISLFALLAIALVASCTKVKKEVTIIYIPTVDTPIVRSFPYHFDNTVYFDQAQNINYYPDTIADSGQLNLWMNNTNAIPGTVVNISCFIYPGVKINLLSAQYGHVSEYRDHVNPGAGEWHFKVTYLGNFNGVNLYEAVTNTYP